MVIVDSALEKIEAEGQEIKVAMVGAGFFGRGVALQFQMAAKGMRLAAISNRTIANAVDAYQQAGVEDVIPVFSPEDLDESIKRRKTCVTSNPFLLCQSREIDVIIEATGDVPFGAE